jgi:hypothetical protein
MLREMIQNTEYRIQDAGCGAVIEDAFNGRTVITVLFLSSM